MNKALTTILFLAVAVVTVWSMKAPQSLSYQGRLTDSSGQPLNGSFDMIFRVYDDSTGGNLIWEGGFPTVPVTEGQFQVYLPIPSPAWDLLWSDELELPEMEWEAYVEPEIEGEVILPRSKLVSTPSAIGASRVGGDIYTAPGRIYMVPGPSVSDCTYVPLEMAVDTSITRIRLKPYNPVSDCTYVPLEMRVDALSSHLHLYPPEPGASVDSVEPAIAMDVSGTSALFEVWGIDPQPFRANHGDPAFSVLADMDQSAVTVRHLTDDPSVTPAIVMNTNRAEAILWMMGIEPQPFQPDPSFSSFSVQANDVASEMILRHPISDPNKEPAILMNVNPASAFFEVWGVEPEPFRAHAYEPSLALRVEEDQSSLTIHHQSVNAGGAADAAYMTLSSAPTSGASLVMFNPQPEPPGDPAMLMAMNSGPTTGASLLMFNPQPEPPGGPDDHTLSLNGGLGNSGPSIFMFNPQPEPPGTPPYLLGMQTSPIGASFEMQSEPGFAKAPSGNNTIDINADTISARIVALNALTNAGGGVIHNEAIVAVNKTDARLTLRNGPPGSANDFSVVAAGIGTRVGINTGSPGEALHVVGNICATGTIGACSDERYKKDIATMTDAITLIEKLRGVNFNWRTDEFPEQKFSDAQQVGFIAQEIEKVLPEVVSKGEDGFYSVDYAKLTPVLVEAVKEQQRSIEVIKSQNAELAKQLSELKKLVQQLTENKRLAAVIE